jgi:ribosomal protein S18 acetylase RimI-like enzyme
MPHISRHILPKNIPDDSPWWEKYAWKVRAARLDSLKLDPNSFLSRYESEAKQPIEFTVGRLKEANAWTVVLVRSREEESPKDATVLLRDDADCVGFCVMIDIRSVSTSMTEREESDLSKKGADWFMAAVYVDRSVRGKGAGKSMIQFGIDAITDISRSKGVEGAVCVTNVMHGNNNALELYKKLGFQVTNADDVEEKEGRIYHTTTLKLTL